MSKEGKKLWNEMDKNQKMKGEINENCLVGIKKIVQK